MNELTQIEIDPLNEERCRERLEGTRVDLDGVVVSGDTLFAYVASLDVERRYFWVSLFAHEFNLENYHALAREYLALT